MDAYLVDWERSDSTLLARHFDNEFDWMNPVGGVVNGGPAMAGFLAGSHRAQDEAGIERSLTQTINGIRLIAPNVAIVDLTYVHVGPVPTPPIGTARSVIVLIERDGRWVRAAQRNYHLFRAP